MFWVQLSAWSLGFKSGLQAFRVGWFRAQGMACRVQRGLGSD